jgi:transposase InsO family protein
MTGGHLALRKTLDQVSRRAYWKGYRRDVERFCRMCSKCAKNHRGPPPRSGNLQPMATGAPMERMEIDLTGPHPRSRNGKTYILTCIDCFTKWADAIAIPNKEAVTVARALVVNVFCRYGLPIQILSDQGNEFDNTLMHELCELLDIDKVRISDYKPSTNGCAERFHRTMNAMIGRVMAENQRNWDEVLPYVMAAYRSSRHSATGYSPNFLVFGREVRAPIDLVLGLPEETHAQSTDHFVDEMKSRLSDAYLLVHKQLGYSAEWSKH